MKGLLILAVLLMVPSMAYYQKQYYAEVLRERLEKEVLKVLIDGEVEEPAVELEWMDARIGGLVGSAEQREKLGALVDEMEGVRLAPQGNGLQVRGWVELAREGGKWKARGLVPKEFVIGLLKDVDQALPWDAELERDESTEAPPRAVEWEKFLTGYFREPGNRSVRLRGDQLSLEGEATRGLRADWLAQASKVVPKQRVEEEFVILPSIYHLKGYVPESSRSSAEVTRLREELEDLTVGFAEDAVEVDVDERERVSAAAGVMLQAGTRVRFVVGVTAADEGEEEGALAEKRLAAVVALLNEYGVAETQLEMQVFVATLDGAPAGRVEFLLK